jgi:hypothetical protein
MGIPDSPWQGRATSSERGSVECAQSKPGARFWTSGPQTLLWDYFLLARDPSLDPLPIQSAQTHSLRSVS